MVAQPMMKVERGCELIGAQVHAALDRLHCAPQLAGKHLLITGATGFFGKWLLALIAGLNERGAQLHVTAVSRSPASFLAGYPQYRNPGWLDWVQADMRTLAGIRLTRDVDFVLHGATDTSAAGQADALQTFETILGGARAVLELALKTRAKRVLFTGSGAQYGALQPGVPVREDCSGACDSTLASSAYAEAKRAQEVMAAVYAQQHGLEVVLTRCFAFAGPGLALDGHFAIGNLIRDALWGRELVLNSSGLSVRSYLYAADLAVWLLTLLVCGESGAAYNVGSDHSLTIAQLAQRVREIIAPEKPLRILGSPDDGAARSFYVPDVEKARTLGLEIWTSLDQSISNMAAWAGNKRPE
ncbi:MAG: NAD-dependent epimerase/dehydratase family protein [Janthinobacterium lividum]